MHEALSTTPWAASRKWPAAPKANRASTARAGDALAARRHVRDGAGKGIDEARKQYDLALKLAGKRALAEPKDSRAQADLATCWHKLGLVSEKQSRTTEAIRCFEKEIEILKPLTEADPLDKAGRRDLAFAYLQLGDARRARRRNAAGPRIVR